MCLAAGDHCLMPPEKEKEDVSDIWIFGKGVDSKLLGQPHPASFLACLLANSELFKFQS